MWETRRLQQGAFVCFHVTSEWPEWKQRFMRYRTATKLSLEDGDVQVSALIYSMGKEAENMFKSFTFGNEDDGVIEMFDKHFIPWRNIIYEHARFHQWCQKDGDSGDIHKGTLWALGTLWFWPIKRWIYPINLSEKLQLQRALMLTRAIEMARSHKLFKNQNTEEME